MFTAGIHDASWDRINGTFCNLEASGAILAFILLPLCSIIVREGFLNSLARQPFKDVKSDPPFLILT